MQRGADYDWDHSEEPTGSKYYNLEGSVANNYGPYYINATEVSGVGYGQNNRTGRKIINKFYTLTVAFAPQTSTTAATGTGAIVLSITHSKYYNLEGSVANNYGPYYINATEAVSYTHLTLPTIYSV